MSPAAPFSEVTLNPPVRGTLHSPLGNVRAGLVLTHGAGANSNTALLIALADAFSDTEILVLRCDLPFRQSRAQGPPRPGDASRDRMGLRNAVEQMRGLLPTEASEAPIFLGGHSYGGRQSSMLAAENPRLVAGLLLLSYPLHPPRKPEQMRTQHFSSIETPSLFVHGTRDPFASIDELSEAIKLIPAKTSLFPIDGAGHDLGFKGKTGTKGLVDEIVTEFARRVALNSLT